MQGANVPAALISALYTVLSSDEQTLAAPVAPTAPENEADLVTSSIPASAQKGLVLDPITGAHSIQGEHALTLQTHLTCSLIDDNPE